MGRLEDKLCMITGAARGQGAAEARLFAAEGGTVWLTDVRELEGRALTRREQQAFHARERACRACLPAPLRLVLAPIA